MTTLRLSEITAKRLLADTGVPVTPTELARTGAEAVEIAARLAGPVVLKIASPDIAHKSDVDGVRLSLAGADAVRSAFDEIVAAAHRHQPAAHIDGVSVQPMARSGGIEVIVGVSVDPHFGHVIMVGLGGILVEVWHDVAFRLLPIEARDARCMLAELRGAALLRGVRNRPSIDHAALEALLMQVSALVTARPDIQELDLNPVLAYPDGVLAVDARILLEGQA